MKICTKCCVAKPLTEFHIHSGQKSGTRPQCKKCVAEYQSQRYLTSKDMQTARSRAYYAEHKSAIIAYKNKHQKSKIKSDPIYKLSRSIRSRVSKLLKGGSAIKSLGCSVQQLRVHLESQFQPGMSWTNHGLRGWHIDHVKPLSSFDLTNPVEFAAATHFTNLQPLWASDNLLKGASLCR